MNPQNTTIPKIVLVLFQCLLRDLAENMHLRKDILKKMREREELSTRRKRKRREKK